MSNKLQELTEKLYNEGLSKGKEEGKLLLARARDEADRIIADARNQAATIVSDAEKQAADLKEKTASDLKMASAQCLQATKKDIENLLVNAIGAAPVEKELSDPDFRKKIIEAVATRFSTEQPGDISLLLPVSLKDKLEPWVEGELRKKLGSGLKADFTKKIAGGFTIGPKDGGWFVSMTDETFSKLLAEYLRPVTRKLLFG